jgi:hypothetical protein
MAAGSTYTPIATNTVSGTSTATVTFSSIAGTYTDLIIVANGSITVNDDTYVQFNGSGGTGYSGTYIAGNGSAASSGRYTSNDRIVADYTSYPTTTGGSWTAIYQFMNYSNATTYKTCLIRSNNAGVGTSASVHLWTSTAAITSIALQCTGTTKWGNGTTFTLYGIAAA